MSSQPTPDDLLQPGHIVKERWKVTKKNWRRWIWRNLRRHRSRHKGASSSKIRIRQATKTSAKDGSGCVKEITRSRPCL